MQLRSRSGCANWLSATAPSFISLFLGSSAVAQQKNAPTADPTVPEIDFQGSDITGTKINVAIGQLLTFSSPQSGDTEQWKVPNAILFAGLNPNTKSCPKYPKASNLSGCVVYGDATHPDFHSTTTTFYFVIPGIYHLYYDITVGNQMAGSSVVVDVVGPTLAAPTIQIGDVGLWPMGCTDQCQLALGNPTQNPPPPANYGVTITSNPTQPKAFRGKFTWAQVIDAQDSYTSIDGTNFTCTLEAGLDDDFPWTEDLAVASGSKIPDTEMWDLVYRTFTNATQASHTTNFEATDYFLWQADVTAAPYTVKSVEASFPVVLSYGGWGWYGVATYSQADGAWELTQKSTYTTPFANEASYGYSVLDWGAVVPTHAQPPCKKQK